MAKYGKKAAKPEPKTDEAIDHGTLIKWVNEADDATLQSRTLSEKSRDYYDSKQWTDEEKAALAKRKQAATVSNRIKPKADSLMGMESTNRTTAKAFPRTPKHEGGAQASTEAVRFVLDDQDFDRIRSSSFENILLEGTGGAEVIVKPVKGKSDEYDVILNHIPWDRLIYDPHSRTKDFNRRGCRYLGQVVWMDYDEAKAKYPSAELEDMLQGSQTYDDKPRWMDTTRRRVKIVELYYAQANGDIWYACFTRGGYCEDPKISPYKDEDGNTEWPYEFASAFVDREGGRYGAVAQLLDMQDEINKRRSKALHLMSVRQVRSERGAVEDVNKARQELAKPDGWIETTPGMEFEVLKTGDMATAQFQLLTEAKQEIDAVGANAALMGKDTHSVSGRALLARETAGKTELAPLFDVLKHWDIRIYRKIWNRIRQYWKAEKWIRVTDDEQNLRWVGLNKKMTKGDLVLQQAQQQKMPPEMLQQVQQLIAQDPTMKEVVHTENDIAQLDVDIVLTEVPDATTSQIEDFQTLGEMVKSGFQIPPMAVIEASPLNNKDKILKMMKEQPQLPPQVQEQMKKLQEQAQKLTQENQALKADQQVEGAKVQAKAAADQQSIAAKAKLQQDELDLERAKVREQLALQKEKQDGEIALARARAEAEIEIIRAKASAEVEIKREAAKHAASAAS